MPRQIIRTVTAPEAIGTYSQAVRVNNTVYLSGQIGLDPQTMNLVDGIEAQITRVFDNLNEIMAQYFAEPYPARAAVGVASLPRGALVEADGIMELAK
jgi:enamine deaminase RidA (YjgF/YER057c/UK114 family)